MCPNPICRSTPHARKCRLVSSGPLSQRIAKGCPRSATIASNTRVTLRLAKLVSTSKAKHSRVYASTTLSTRIARPQSTASCTKSSAHSWFAAAPAPSRCPTPPPGLRFTVQTQICRQLPPLGVLIAQLFGLLCLAHIHATVLCLPRIDRVLRYAHFPRHIFCFTACFQLLQRPDHLRFRVPALRHTLFPF